MNSISDYIENYMVDGSYRGLVSKFTRSSNKDLLDKLDNYLLSKGFDIEYNSVSQKLYSVINNVKSVPKCYCGNDLNYKNINIGYYEYCSSSCQVSSDDTQLKIRKSNISKYGVSHHTKRESFRQLMVDKNKDGDLGFGSVKYKNSIMDKYGVDNISKVNGVGEKKRETWMKNWESLSESERVSILDNRNSKYKKTRMANFFIKFNQKWINRYGILESNKYETISGVLSRGLYKIFCHGCNSNFEILKSSLYQRESMGHELCINCNPYNVNSSMGEVEIFNFLSEYIDNIEVNNRSVLNNKEIDIFLPELNIGIEYNGLYWHSELYKEDKYHMEKSDLAEESGIRLIHIFEDEWTFKKEIVKSRLLNLLGESEKIYARKCEIREISDNRLLKEFLMKNHIQGFVGSKIKLGLFYNNELVSIMTFGNLRKNLGQNSKEGSYELLRFCNKLNTSVVGGASRLFKYFLKTYKPDYILSYADRRWSNGNLYEKLEFNFIHNSSPSWSYPINGERRNRFSFRKDVLVSEGFDENKTAREIMLERGYYRIYDSGSKKYEWYV